MIRNIIAGIGPALIRGRQSPRGSCAAGIVQ
jgi:hypothetical protein